MRVILWISVVVALFLNCIVGNTCILDSSSNNSPKKTGNRWAIVALARPGKAETAQRNKLLSEKLRPFANLHNISVLMFSEKKFSTSEMKSFENAFNGVAVVRYINTADRGFNGKERYGYKYMCKFFSIDIYDYLRDQYDYYMRCDTDCYIQSLNYDLLKWAEDNDVGYGFGARKLEAHKPTRDTLPVWTNTYMNQCGIKSAQAPMDFPLSTCFNFYNNWHIGRVSFFNRPDVRHYLESVNSSGFIMSHRWGDSTIQAYAVRLFMNPLEIKQVPNFKYTHGSHSKTVSTFGNGEETDVPQKLSMWK